MSELSYDRLVTELVAQATDFAELVAGAGDDLRVPTCPKWTLGDLVGHLGLAYHRALLLVTGRERLAVPFEDIPVEAPARPDGAWALEGAEKLASALAELTPATVLKTWVFDLSARFWPRRLTCDTVVHRADAAFTVRKPYEVAADLAAEVVSEGFDLLRARMATDPTPAIEALKGTGETLHFHATDDDLGETGEWLVHRTPDGITWEHAHGRGDVAVRASAADLMLGLTGRIPIDDRFTIFGDAALLTHWRAHTKF